MINPREIINDSKLIWIYNINQEQRWNTYNFFPSITDKHQLELAYQQEQQQLFLANQNDLVVFHHTPDEAFLQYLTNIGIQLPRIVKKEDFGNEQINLYGFETIIPYIVSEEVINYSKLIPNTRVFGSDLKLVKKINNKFFTRKLAESHGFNVTEGFFCSNTDMLKLAYNSLRKSGFEKCVLKIPFGSSGKGLKIIENESSLHQLIKYISRRKDKFNLLIEGWHPIQQNINCQLWIDEHRINILAITEQLIDYRAVYLGTNFTPNISLNIIEEYRRNMFYLGEILRSMGYYGICGIDSIIDVNGKLYPIIEINARLTQVTYIIPLVKSLIPSYSHIVSRYFNIVMKKSVDFTFIYQKLQKALKPSTNCGFIIYTFANHILEDKSTTKYRIYLLFFSNDYLKILKMIEELENINWDE